MGFFYRTIRYLTIWIIVGLKDGGGGGGDTVSHKNPTLLISWQINIFWSTQFNSNFYSSLDISTYFDQHNLIAIFAKKWWFFIVFCRLYQKIIIRMVLNGIKPVSKLLYLQDGWERDKTGLRVWWETSNNEGKF